MSPPLLVESIRPRAFTQTFSSSDNEQYPASDSLSQAAQSSLSGGKFIVQSGPIGASRKLYERRA